MRLPLAFAAALAMTCLAAYAQFVQKTAQPLEPSGTNAMEAKGNFATGGKAAATITLAGKKPQEVTWRALK